MPLRKGRGFRRLRKVLEEWIKEDSLFDSSDSSDSEYEKLSSKESRIPKYVMEGRQSNLSSTSGQEFVDKPSTSSEEDRTSSRQSEASSVPTDFPPPPNYDSVVGDRATPNPKQTDSDWERTIGQMVDDFGRKCTNSNYSTMPTRGRQSSSGAQSLIEETRMRDRTSSPRASSALGFDRNFDWDRPLSGNDDFFRDSRLRQRRSPFSHFNMTSPFQDEIDRFFGRGTLDRQWDTFFPEIRFPEFGLSSSLGDRMTTEKSRDLPIAKVDDSFKVEVDVQGFQPNELLVKTVGQSLIVMAKTEAASAPGDAAVNRSFRELRREFTIPPNVNPLDVSSRLTPEGILVVEAPTSDKLKLESNDQKQNAIENP